MIIEYDDNYGADADDNRGISVIDDVQLDDTDADDIEMIKEQIQEEYMSYEFTPERARDFFEDEVTIHVDVDGADFEFEEKPINWYDSIEEFVQAVAVQG